ncbi:MAG: hypothetical protein VX843_03095 [Actinomycetota bacterium]|jgi:hypothetical protein|nr:hypothetical protein [Acidimicrobiaceae bacterium]MEE2646199.1 hypothetical protein [Actinomycetota bacterium]|tara:strand:+ start:746 stop:1093 length:348 start_codon:yes stop_codon:yes gene_type:complete
MAELYQIQDSENSENFAHDSEKRVAELFDFYGVSWEYEPTTFVLEEDESGNPLSAFTPDFYLPEHDLYLEITTLRQPLVTHKNKKLRKMSEKYPDVNVRILYQRDIERLFITHAA